MVRVRIVGLVAATLLMTTTGLSAGIAVNEVLVNEPGGQTALEWIELFNGSDTTVSLSGWNLDINDGSHSVSLPDGTAIGPHGFLIVCRRLYGQEGTSFEGHWGDSSGVWGDNPWEELLPEPIEAAFALVNESGRIRLTGAQGELISEIAWPAGGADGVSWERVDPKSDAVAQSISAGGSTPGAVNSVVRRDRDLSLQLLKVRFGRENRIEWLVRNAGREATAGTLYVTVDSAVNTYYQLWDSVSLPMLQPGDSLAVCKSFPRPPEDTRLISRLGDDDNAANDSAGLVAPGGSWPPSLHLSEVLADPEGELASEWIELENRSDSIIQLAQWLIGDSRGEAALTDNGGILAPSGFAVAAEDTMAFGAFYPKYSGMLFQPEPWPTLNNQGDTVRLVSREHGYIYDAFGYDHGHGENYTWCIENGTSGIEWFRSQRSGGTPGRENRVYREIAVETFSLYIEPRVFSPDGDGVEDAVIIDVDPPVAGAGSLEIYDRTGRCVLSRSFDPAVDGAVGTGTAARLPDDACRSGSISCCSSRLRARLSKKRW